MSIPTIERPTFGAQLGGNIGKSLAEQLPQEMGRQRLANALKGMQGQNLSPMDYAQKIVQAGGSLQDVSSLLPILANTQYQNALKQQSEGAGTPGAINQNQTNINTSTTQQPPSQYKTPEQILEIKHNRAQAADPKKVAQLAISYGGTPQAYKQAEDYYKDLKKTQQENLDTFYKELENRYNDIFQARGLEDYGKQLTGRSLQWFKDQGEAMIQNGIPDAEAATILGKDMEKFGDALLKAKENAGKYSITSGSDAKMSGILPEREIAKQLHQEDQFDKVIIKELGISANTYYDRINPITNPKLKQEIKKARTASDKVKYFQHHVIPRMKPTDNPQSVIKELIRLDPKGYFIKSDPTAFLTAMREAKRNGTLHLNEENERILDSFTASTPNYHDALFDTYR